MNGDTFITFCGNTICFYPGDKVTKIISTPKGLKEEFLCDLNENIEIINFALGGVAIFGDE